MTPIGSDTGVMGKSLDVFVTPLPKWVLMLQSLGKWFDVFVTSHTQILVMILQSLARMSSIGVLQYIGIPIEVVLPISA